MTLAIRGDRATCLSVQLGPRTWLLAAARGFGCAGGLAIESALLARLGAECRRRARSARFRRTIDRPQSAASSIIGMLSRISADLYACTASHEDYVVAAASLTAVLVVQRRAFVMQAGSTAAYLAHDGDLAVISGDDALDLPGTPVLFHAVGTGPLLDLAISSATLAPGDAIVLLDRRLRSPSERQALLAQLEAADPGEHVLVARFEGDDSMQDQTGAASIRKPAKVSLLARAVAGLGFLLATVCIH
ncbi:MAG TPA: hypothetical protein VFF63_08765 [Candidatus Babeliales bacterium]|nr:hypothetical protein [Candidatus Babeliales bacterium]